jgi:ketoreductase RED2
VSKAALIHLLVLLANVHGPQIRVDAVGPGLIEPPWTAESDAVPEPFETWAAPA